MGERERGYNQNVSILHYLWQNGMSGFSSKRRMEVRYSPRRGAVLLILALTLAACSVAPVPTELPTPTLLPPTATLEPTTVWFPPTATFTPFPTLEPATPMPDLRTGIGEVILEDDFSQEQFWELGFTSAGSVALGKNTLSLATEGGKVYLSSVRNQPVLTDFYLEVTASVSLCSDRDEYGLLLRVSPARDLYRFSLACDGYTRMDRVAQGVASSPVPWTPSGAVLPGAPGPARLAVWAVGTEMHFFINDIYQYTVRDPLLLSGQIGFFARSVNDEPLTVNFSDLVVYAAGK